MPPLGSADEAQPLLCARVRDVKGPPLKMARDAGDVRDRVGDKQGAIGVKEVAHALQQVRGAGGHLGVDRTVERRLVGLDRRLERHLCEYDDPRRFIPDED